MQKGQLITNIPWEELKPLIDGKYKVFFERIDPSLYKLILDDLNEFTVKESIFKLLKNDKSNIATQVNIDELYLLIKKVAEQRSKK